jgi:hypothetical protein
MSWLKVVPRRAVSFEVFEQVCTESEAECPAGVRLPVPYKSRSCLLSSSISSLMTEYCTVFRYMAIRAAELVFGCSFYKQGSSVTLPLQASSLMPLSLGDPDPRLGTAWERNLNDGFALRPCRLDS